MLGIKRTIGRPAAWRRRSLLTGVLLALGLLPACSEPGAFDVGAARSACRQAVRRLSTAAPEEARVIEGLVARAERVTARERARVWGEAEPVQEAWLAALRRSYDSVAATRQRETVARQQWLEVEAAAAAALSNAQRQAKDPGMGLGGSMAAESAAGHLAAARRLAAGGVYDEAVLLARRALTDVERVNGRWDGLQRRLNDPTLLRVWRRWADETIEQSRRQHDVALVADKAARRLYVYSSGRLTRSFALELGTNGLVPKRHSGDRATPEGQYRVLRLKKGGDTKYYKALLIDYPNDSDRARFRELSRQGALPRGVGLGGLIEIHGEGGQGRDWTEGCLALKNTDMDELFPLVRVHTPVTIVGSLRRGG